MGFESVFLYSPNKGFGACLGDLPSGMPRRPEPHLFKSGSAIVGSDSPRVTIAKGNSIFPTCET